MRLNFSKQLTQLIASAKLLSMAGVLGAGLLVSTGVGQEEAPSYTPGSVIQKPLSLLEENEWTPPETDVQESPSDWVPPVTDSRQEAQKLVVESEDVTQPFGSGIPVDNQEVMQPPVDSLVEPPPEDGGAFSKNTPVNSGYFQSPVEAGNTPEMVAIHSESPDLNDPTSVLGTSVLTDASAGSNISLSGDSGVITNEFYGDGGLASGCDSCSEGVVIDGACQSGCEPGVEVGTAVGGKRPLRNLFGKGRAALSNVRSSVASTGTYVDQGGEVFEQDGITGGSGRGRAALAQARGALGQTRAAIGGRLSGLKGGEVVQPGFTPVRNILRGASSRLGANTEVNSIGQLTFLSFGRDYRTRGRQLSRGVPNLFSNGPDENEFTGVDFSYGQRRAGGRGWEWRFIGFNPARATDVAGSAPQLVWGGLAPPLNDPDTWGGLINTNTPQTFGLSGIGFGLQTMADVFGDAQNHRVTRDSEFGSFEFNMLRAATGGSRLTFGSSMLEVFGGLRAVAFNETMVFTAAATQSAISPASAFYSSEVKNGLFGLQVGGRLERPLRNQGWGMSFGTRVGIYNNRVESRQNAQFQYDDGSRPTPVVQYGENAGREFDFTGVDHELAFLGELDFGLIYRFRPQTRARFGFRGLAVTNVATASGQLEDSLFDIDRVEEPNVLGDLIVGGLYFGVDHAF